MVRISKDGIFFEFIEIDGEGNEEIKTVDIFKENIGLMSYLTFPTEIDEGVTVENIMNLLAINADVTDYIFDSALSGHSFLDFFDEMKEDLPSDPILDIMEIAYESDPLVDDNELFSIVRMRGLSKNKDSYSVEFSQISSYKKLEIKLNNNYIIKKLVGEKEVTILSCLKSFTLFDVINSILYEMSYYGDSETRKLVLKEVAVSLGVKSITAFKLSDNDDNMEGLRKQLSESIENEEYEKAALIRDKIEKQYQNYIKKGQIFFDKLIDYYEKEYKSSDIFDRTVKTIRLKYKNKQFFLELNFNEEYQYGQISVFESEKGTGIKNPKFVPKITSSLLYDSTGNIFIAGGLAHTDPNNLAEDIIKEIIKK